MRDNSMVVGWIGNHPLRNRAVRPGPLTWAEGLIVHWWIILTFKVAVI